MSQVARLADLDGHDRWRSRVRGLPEALGDLPSATLADEIESLYLGEGNPGGPLETEVASLVAAARLEAASFIAERSGPEVERLERLVRLLDEVEEYHPLAALYARTIVDRYSPLVDSSPDIKKSVETAREYLARYGLVARVLDSLPPNPAKAN